jgi:hypothetical protein
VNLRLADALVSHLPAALQSDYFGKIADHYDVGGNVPRTVEFLSLRFDQCVNMEYHDEVQELGGRCLELIDRLDASTPHLTIDPRRAGILLQMGISQSVQRRFELMEQSFNACLRTGRVRRGRALLVEAIRTATYFLTQPQESEDTVRHLYRLLERLDDADSSDPEVIDAKLHTLNTIFTFQKQHRADYEEALRVNAMAIDLCQQYGRASTLIWERINRGTMILFRDEACRDRLDFNAASKCWRDALEYWTDVLNEAENSRGAEHVIETNCAVGFMKMYLGFRNGDELLKNEAYDHFVWARELGQKFGHPYWLMKQHNHFGIHAALRGELGTAEEELRKGLVVADRLKNTFTPWMMRQNLANIEFIRHDEAEVYQHWSAGLKIALTRYFVSNQAALRNYQFRQFLRGLFLHAGFQRELVDIIGEYEGLDRAIAEDESISSFKARSLAKEPFKAIREDLYFSEGCYFNTH